MKHGFIDIRQASCKDAILITLGKGAERLQPRGGNVRKKNRAVHKRCKR
jgi:hypothetical protein